MTTYAVAYLNVSDPAVFGAYREKAAAALAKHGGKVALVAPQPIRLEGSLEAPETMVLLSFETPDGAEQWHADPALAEIHELRRGGAEVSIFVMKETA